MVPHRDVAGSTRHGPFVAPDCSWAPVAKADDPMTLVNVMVPPGRTIFVSGFAVGASGAETVGVIVALTYRPRLSVRQGLKLSA